MQSAEDRVRAAAGCALVHDDRDEDPPAPNLAPAFTLREIFVLGAGFGLGFGFCCLIAAALIAGAVLSS